MATDYEEGVLVGLLVGEGHFGGDGRQPHVTLRMHVRHEALFRWIERTFPGGRLYGPYDHGGRRYYQWMARGAFLRDELLPLLRRRLTPQLDAYAGRRLEAMLERFHRQLGPLPTPAATGGGSVAETTGSVATGTSPTTGSTTAPPRDPHPPTPGPRHAQTPPARTLDSDTVFRALRGPTP